MLRALPTIAKAVAAGATAAAGLFATALVADSTGVVAVTGYEWVTIALGTIAAAAAVYRIPNAAAPAEFEEDLADDSLL